MKKLIYIATDCTDKLLDVLIMWGGKYEIDTGLGRRMAYLYIYENDKYFQIISDCLPENAIVSISKVFTKKEMDAAEWLTIRATTQTLNLERDEEALLCDCIINGDLFYHRVRSGNPVFMSKIKWTTRKHFNSSYTLSLNHLFCDELARKVLIQKSKGISFENVLHWRTEKAIDNVYEIRFEQKIQRGDIILDDCEKYAIQCPSCGLKTYSLGGECSLILRRESIPQGLNAFCTEAIFGGVLLTPINIISQELYQLIREKEIDRGLLFEPVVLV